jgi:hypothetical protein
METGNVIKRTCKLRRLRRLRKSDLLFVLGSNANDFQHSFIWEKPTADAARIQLQSQEDKFSLGLELVPWTNLASSGLVHNGISYTDLSRCHELMLAVHLAGTSVWPSRPSYPTPF